MKKSLFDTRVVESLIIRLELLTVETPHLWGQMNATEMLWHCNSCNKEILEGERGNKKTTITQYLLRILALYIAPNFKKGISSERHHIACGTVDNSQFEYEKTCFISLIKEFPKCEKRLNLSHPAFGNISTKEWGIAAYKHMDHHFRQFGI